MSSDVTRFAPSPTGLLHLGHAFSALFAAKHGQRFLLRLEDIDPARCRPEFEAAIYVDLAWLGLTWEQPVRRQSGHMADYARALDRLTAQGLLYPCACTRADIIRAGHAPQNDFGDVYPGTCRGRDVDLSRPYALRLDMEKAMAAVKGPLKWRDRATGWHEANPRMFGDVVLARKDTPASYHLCVVHDDALQGVTLVTRGAELAEFTPLHRLLQALLGLPTPDYLHHPMLKDEAGRRYAKRDNSPSLKAMREAGMTADEVKAQVSEIR